MPWQQFDLNPQFADQSWQPKRNATNLLWLRRAAMYIFRQAPQAASTAAAWKDAMHALRFGAFRFFDKQTQFQRFDGPAAASFLDWKIF